MQASEARCAQTRVDPVACSQPVAEGSRMQAGGELWSRRLFSSGQSARQELCTVFRRMWMVDVYVKLAGADRAGSGRDQEACYLTALRSAKHCMCVQSQNLTAQRGSLPPASGRGWACVSHLLLSRLDTPAWQASHACSGQGSAVLPGQTKKGGRSAPRCGKRGGLHAAGKNRRSLRTGTAAGKTRGPLPWPVHSVHSAAKGAATPDGCPDHFTRCTCCPPSLTTCTLG